MSQFRRCQVFFCSLLLAFASIPGAKAEETVDVALVLAVDVSRSMSFEELRIQRKGYASAISSPEVLRAIRQGAYGRIAVTLFEWAVDSYFREVVSWTVIETAADAEAVSAKLLAENSRAERRTSISGAIRHALDVLDFAPVRADRRVIDISGDGPNNQGVAVTTLRDMAVAAGVTINGLPLMTDSGFGSQFNIPDLDRYYENCVIGGPGSFVIPVNNWDQFAEAVRRKLVLEIGRLEPSQPKVIPAQFKRPDPYDCLVGEKIWQQRQWRFDDFDR